MTLTEEFARLLHQLGLGVYDDTGVTGDIYLDRLPPEPDAGFAVVRYGAGEADSKLPYEEINLQVRVRGPAGDARVAERRAQAVYDALHGLSNRELPGGTQLMLAVGNQGGPIRLGPDQHDRPEYTVNLRAELHRPTTNRP